MDSKWTDSGKVLILKSDWKKLGLNKVATSAPSNPEEGEPWYESDLNAFGVYNGSTWVSNFKITDIVDATGLELLKFSATGSAVNELTVKNNITANAPEIQATGSDDNISIKLLPKGTGTVIAATITGNLTGNVTGNLAGNVTGSLVLGSDADGDIYYRSGSVLTRLPKGSDGQVLTLSSGLPAWG